MRSHPHRVRSRFSTRTISELRQSVSRALRLFNEDVLKVDFTQLGNALRIVGNLPYNISTPLLFKLLERGNQIQIFT